MRSSRAAAGDFDELASVELEFRLAVQQAQQAALGAGGEQRVGGRGRYRPIVQFELRQGGWFEIFESRRFHSRIGNDSTMRGHHLDHPRGVGRRPWTPTLRGRYRISISCAFIPKLGMKSTIFRISTPLPC